MSDELTPVLFRVSRASRRDGSEVTAVFPTEPATNCGIDMLCYAHIGQHGSCSPSWFYTTRPATEAEYADIKRELESAPYNYRLKIYQRITRDLTRRRHAALRSHA